MVGACAILAAELGAGYIMARGDDLSDPLRVSRPPAVLPENVQREYDSALKVVNQQGGQGSGVKVGSNLAFTAGHEMFSADPKQNQVNQCGSITINVNSSPGHEDEVTNWAGYSHESMRDGQDNAGFPDYALLRVRPDPDFDKLPIAPLADSTPAAGDPVYFVNYEAGEYLFSRVPGHGELQQRATLEALYKGDGYSHAAEFAGIVVGRNNDGSVIVANGIQGYGRRGVQEKILRPGGSGGPVFNAIGQLWGISDATYDITPEPTAASVAKKYGVSLPVPANTKVGLSLVQPVDKSLLNSAENTLDHGSPCASQPQPVTPYVSYHPQLANVTSNIVWVKE